jgi:acetolactate synthase-1/2/3 large subunit
LLTAVAEAYVGCLPMVVFAGRAVTGNVYRGASQEVPTERIFAPVTKWAVRVDRADLVTDVVRRAFVIARGGKPGPVLIDLPRDVLDARVVDRPYVPAGPAARPAGEGVRVAAAAEVLAGAERPIIVAGGGVVASGAFGGVRSLAERLCAPVLTSLAGRGSIPEDHPLAVGGLGAHHNRVSGRQLAEADVVLSLGCRFEEMETNWSPRALPAPDATVVQVDIDPAEIGRSVAAGIGIVGDVAAVAGQLQAALAERGVAAPAGGFRSHPRVAGIAAEMASLEREASRLASGSQPGLHPLLVIERVRAALPRQATVAFDVGCIAQHMAGASPYFKVFEPRSTIVPSSFYGMGFAAAALPCARLVYPDRPALGFVGDGSFQMVMNILPVAAEYRLGVTWCVMNDGALGSIRDIQEYRLGSRIIDTEFRVQPDFAALARSCGCHGDTVKDPASIDAALTSALKANEAGVPAVIDFVVAPERVLGTLEYYGFYPPAMVDSQRRPPPTPETTPPTTPETTR